MWHVVTRYRGTVISEKSGTSILTLNMEIGRSLEVDWPTRLRDITFRNTVICLHRRNVRNSNLRHIHSIRNYRTLPCVFVFGLYPFESWTVCRPPWLRGFVLLGPVHTSVISSGELAAASYLRFLKTQVYWPHTHLSPSSLRWRTFTWSPQIPPAPQRHRLANASVHYLSSSWVIRTSGFPQTC
jgi:hypothetical protein